MKYIVKLLTAVSVLGFLVGCGGGGDETDENNDPQKSQISFADIESTFSVDFPVPAGSKVVSIDKYKVYSATQAAFNDLNATVLKPGKYILASNGYHISEDTTTKITYYAEHNKTAGTIRTGIYTYSNFAGLSDDIFDYEFGVVDGKFAKAVKYVRYEGSISSQYSNYATNQRYLPSLGFNNCKSTEGNWRCSKSDSKFTYIWETIDAYTYQYIITAK
ncbi:MAG: hypothetical protein LBQ18_06920 [Campylobacteraceae bacterium]|jgi:hypothetical protein|nr:hypothetical protein [Campylobacteraceae bacterium]